MLDDEPGRAGYDYIDTAKGRIKKRFIQYRFEETCSCGNKITWYLTTTAGRPSSVKRFKQCHMCASRQWLDHGPGGFPNRAQMNALRERSH